MASLRHRVRAVIARARRIERRELAEFLAWLETTSHLVHLTGLFAVPLLIVAVTSISNATDVLPFVLFPPLASGTFTLFSDPGGRYADPWRFVAGLTVGALCGTVAVLLTIRSGLVVSGTQTFATAVSPVAAGLAVFLTGAVTWGFDIEEPSAFSTALLAILIPASGAPLMHGLALYVVFTAIASAAIASAFTLWHTRVYQRRADILYRSTESANHVLVPVRDDSAEVTATLAGALAGDAGTVHLLDMVESADVAEAERTLLHANTPSAAAANAHSFDEAEPDDETLTTDCVTMAAPGAARLEGISNRVTARTGTQCEEVVATGDTPASIVSGTALELDCDLIATSYESHDGRLSPFVSALFRGSVDVLAHDPAEDHRSSWPNVLVPVRRASDVAHEMLAFASRLAGGGQVTLATCIGPDGDRRRAEAMLADLAETCSSDVETRVSRLEVEAFLERTAPRFDLILMGASRDRSKASRVLSPPTFERVGDVDADMAILDRNVRY